MLIGKRWPFLVIGSAIAYVGNYRIGGLDQRLGKTPPLRMLLRIWFSRHGTGFSRNGTGSFPNAR